jgi:hypothetical protein
VDHDATAEIEDEEHEDLAEPEVIGLHEVTDPRDVIFKNVAQRWPSPGWRAPVMYR